MPTGCVTKRFLCRDRQSPSELHWGTAGSPQDLLPAQGAPAQGSEWGGGQVPLWGWLLSADSASFLGGIRQFSMRVLKYWPRVTWKKKKKKELVRAVGNWKLLNHNKVLSQTCCPFTPSWWHSLDSLNHSSRQLSQRGHRHPSVGRHLPKQTIHLLLFLQSTCNLKA